MSDELLIANLQAAAIVVESLSDHQKDEAEQVMYSSAVAFITSALTPQPKPTVELFDILWSVRTRRAFERGGINDISELTSKTAAELLDIRNFGQTSLNEVRSCLAARGLSLRGESPKSA